MKITARWAGLPAAVTTIVALAAIAPAGASAATCNGTSIIGEGSSFQNIAQNAPGGTVLSSTGSSIPGDQGWKNLFKSGYTSATGSHVAQWCSASGSFNTTGQTITYNSTGSGNGVNAWGAQRPNGTNYVPQAGFRSGTVSNPDSTGTYKNYADRFTAYDDAPSPGEQAKMNNGDPANGFQPGILHNIPVAQGAIANIVNFPDGCTWASSFNHKLDAAGQTTRFKVPNATLEKVWAGSITTWGGMFNNHLTPASCNSLTITRVVRQDSSGTTFNFKQWLDLVSHRTGGSGTDWGMTGTGYNTPGNNTNWPAPTIHNAGSGGGNLATTVAGTDGSIGYAFLGDARAKGFDMTATTPGTQADTTFWLPIYNDASPTPKLLDPQANGNDGYKAGQGINTHGSNCSKATYHGIPTNGLPGYTGSAVANDPTTSDQWAAASGIGQSVAYEMCYMSWIGVWDDYSNVYGSSAAEGKKFSSVKDYLNMILATGQTMLPLDDYAKLPTALGSAYNDGSGPSVATLAKNGMKNVHL